MRTLMVVATSATSAVFMRMPFRGRGRAILSVSICRRLAWSLSKNIRISRRAGTVRRKSWQALALAGGTGFACAIGVHFCIGYLIFSHLAPAFAGAALLIL